MEKNNRKGWLVKTALCLLFLSPIFSYLIIALEGGNTFLFEDGLLYSFPLRVFLNNSFQQGFSPQWMPYSACGFSLLAEGQSSLCFPATQLIYRFFSAEIGWFMEMILGHLVGFFCCYHFLRHLGISKSACLFGAALYAFCIFALFKPMIPSLMWCYFLLPALLRACSRFLHRQPHSSPELLLAITLVFLTGHPVMIIYSGIITAIYVVWEVLSLPSADKRIGTLSLNLLVLCGLLILAIAISMPQWLPMLEQYRFSARTVESGLSLDALQDTLHLDASWLSLSLFPAPPDSTQWQFFSSIMRFPVYAVFLAIAGALYTVKKPRFGYFIFLLVFVLLMAAGPHIGLWKLVHSLPVLRNFRFPFRWLSFFPLCISVLAAIGLDQLIRYSTAASENSFSRILRVLLAAAVIIQVVIVLLHPEKYLSCNRLAFQTRPTLTILLWASTFGMVLTAIWNTARIPNRKSIACGVILTLFSLFITRAFYFYDSGVLLTLQTIGYKQDVLDTEPSQYRTASAIRPYAAWRSREIETLHPYLPNLSLLQGRLNAGHYCSFIPYWAADMSLWSQNALKGHDEYQNIMNICSVKWLLIPGLSQAKQPGAMNETSVFEVVENLDAIPRANIIRSQVLCKSEAELVSFLKSSAFDPRKSVAFMEQDQIFSARHSLSSPSLSQSIEPKATLAVDRPDYIEVEINPATHDMSFLVLSDTYYPGWRVFVDGAEQQILRANYAFRGVVLPEGSQRVVFTFDPLIPDFVLVVPTIIVISLGIWLIVIYMPRKTLL